MTLTCACIIIAAYNDARIHCCGCHADSKIQLCPSFYGFKVDCAERFTQAKYVHLQAMWSDMAPAHTHIRQGSCMPTCAEYQPNSTFACPGASKKSWTPKLDQTAIAAQPHVYTEFNSKAANVLAHVLSFMQNSIGYRIHGFLNWQRMRGRLLAGPVRMQKTKHRSEGVGYPIVIVPGFITSHLELDAGKRCLDGYARCDVPPLMLHVFPLAYSFSKGGNDIK